jgi:hypothetical protein
LGQIAGIYYAQEIDQTYELKMDGQNLVLHRKRAQPQELRPTYTDAFADGGSTIRLVREKGKVTGFILDAGRTRGLKFVRR